MITDRRISFSLEISFDVQQGAEITELEDLKGQVRNAVWAYYPESNPYIRMQVQYSIWEREADE